MRQYLNALNRWADEHWGTAMAIGTVLSFGVAAALFGPLWGAAWAAGWFATYSVVRLSDRRKREIVDWVVERTRTDSSR